MDFSLRHAVLDDVKVIHGFLLSAAGQGQLLSRPLHSIYTHIRDFIVLVDKKDQVRGCCAVSVIWDNLAEVRSLYVDEDLRGLRLGRKLVEAGMDLTLDLGVTRFFSLTYAVPFFASMGFAEISKDQLPQKVWTDCLNCPKFPHCDEVAMLKDMPPKPLNLQIL
jgi:N-acetylglutamate synthase and related acetyltransferases